MTLQRRCSRGVTMGVQQSCGQSCPSVPQLSYSRSFLFHQPYVRGVPVQAHPIQYCILMVLGLPKRYAIKVVFKWCLNGLGKIWDHSNPISTRFKHNFLTNRGWPPATPPKVGAAASGRRPQFGMSICQKMLFKSCLNSI